jgi:ABC-type dipeptide/oligopeptide/nickel transport system permease component
VGVSFVICHYIYFDSLEFTPERLLIVVATLVSSYLGLSLAGLCRIDRNYHVNKLVTLLSLAWLSIGLFVSMLAFLSKIAVEVSRAWFALSMVSAYIALVSARVVSGLLHFQSNKRGLSGCVSGDCEHLSRSNVNT